MKMSKRGLNEALEVVRKVFDNVSIDFHGDVMIVHRGVTYGVRTGRYKHIPDEIPLKTVTYDIANDIITMTYREIIKKDCPNE